MWENSTLPFANSLLLVLIDVKSCSSVGGEERTCGLAEAEMRFYIMTSLPTPVEPNPLLLIRLSCVA